MAKQGAHRLARRSRQSARRRPGMDWKRVALWSAAIGIVAVLGYFAIQLANPESSVDADTLTLAEGNAGSNVDALTGSKHTVYHSSAPLPDANSPQPDGKPTLVWFSGTWCEFCHSMEPFAHSVMSQFREEAVLVEKSVDDDRSAAARYGVRGTPTFVLIDASGRQLTRFGYQPSADQFAARIAEALSLGG